MAFRVRSFIEILDGMLATTVANSELTDVNVGAADRTLLEAAALSDADQYIQIARVKNAYSIENATGTDLDERAADYGPDLKRLPPSQSIGLVRFGDTNYKVKVSNTLSALASIGAGSVTLTSGASFPTTGGLVFERDTVGQRETVRYTARVGNVFTLAAPLTIAHPNGTSVILSTTGTDRVFPSGTRVLVPATDAVAEIDFSTQASATLKDGEILTSPVTAISVLTGAALNVGTSQISGLLSPPFQTAYALNEAPMQGGRDEETDDDFRQRIKETIQALSNGTYNDILVAASGVSLTTGQRVINVQEVEQFVDPDVTVFIDDGTGMVETTASLVGTELLIYPAELGQRRSRLGNWPVVSGTLNLKKSDFRGTVTSVVNGVGSSVMNVAGTPFVAAALVGRKVFDANRVLFTITANTTSSFTVTTSTINPVPGTYAILAATFLVLGTDYLFNETNGDIELVSGLVAGDALAASPNPTNAYTYYTGLIREVQKVLNGDPTDLVNYPGVKASGIKVKVQAPTISTFSFTITVISVFGTVEADLVAQIRDAVVRYVNGLGVGDDVILAEIVAACMAIPGVSDVRVNDPSTNAIVLDGSLPRTKASLITVL